MPDPIPYDYPDFLNYGPQDNQPQAQPITKDLPSPSPPPPQPLTLDEEIKLAIMTLDNESPIESITSLTEPSEFDTPATVETDQTNDDNIQQQQQLLLPDKVNIGTISSIKQAMVDTSKLLSLYTTLKTTYLKLCKEFNYLLGKFNENEKIKIELIHENNELRRLLHELIKERELERDGMEF